MDKQRSPSIGSTVYTLYIQYMYMYTPLTFPFQLHVSAPSFQFDAFVLSPQLVPGGRNPSIQRPTRWLVITCLFDSVHFGLSCHTFNILFSICTNRIIPYLHIWQRSVRCQVVKWIGDIIQFYMKILWFVPVIQVLITQGADYYFNI